MKPGPRPTSPSTKLTRATKRPRDNSVVELTAPNDLPQQPPDFLTPVGAEIWLDLVGDVAQLGGARPDSMALGLLANLLGAIRQAYQAGEVPPISAMAEARKLLESFGMVGPASRILRGGGQTPRGGEPNPWARFREP